MLTSITTGAQTADSAGALTGTYDASALSGDFTLELCITELAAGKVASIAIEYRGQGRKCIDAGRGGRKCRVFGGGWRRNSATYWHGVEDVDPVDGGLGGGALAGSDEAASGEVVERVLHVSAAGFACGCEFSAADADAVRTAQLPACELVQDAELGFLEGWEEGAEGFKSDCR